MLEMQFDGGEGEDLFALQFAPVPTSDFHLMERLIFLHLFIQVGLLFFSFFHMFKQTR